jgi:cell division transport system ATP-binding protein
MTLVSTGEGLALTAIAPPLVVEAPDLLEPEVAVAELPAPAATPVPQPAALRRKFIYAPAALLMHAINPAPPELQEVEAPEVAQVQKRRPKPRVRLPEPPAQVARPGELQVEFRDVSVGFGSISALRGVSFTIRAGELVFLIGASGAGKTTTFRVISGQLRPTRGQVWVDGTPVHKARRGRVAALRRRIGFVGEDYGLLANRTSVENVEFALRVADLSLPRSEARRRSMAELRNVGLAARAQAKPGELSTGQRQRLALARALVTRPVILLADEPTAGLDSRNAIRMLRLLQRAAARQTAVVIATHDGPLAASVTARVLSLEKGKLQGDFPSWVELCRAE